MQNISESEMLKHLGGSAAYIKEELSSFRGSAKLLSSDHPRMIDEHPLQWIGVYEGKVAATGKSLKSLMLQLEKMKIPAKDAVIRFIDKEERVMIL
jgi:hypothetical protein